MYNNTSNYWFTLNLYYIIPSLNSFADNSVLGFADGVDHDQAAQKIQVLI